jgi:hypothetical protein
VRGCIIARLCLYERCWHLCVCVCVCVLSIHVHELANCVSCVWTSDSTRAKKASSTVATSTLDTSTYIGREKVNFVHIVGVVFAFGVRGKYVDVDMS